MLQFSETIISIAKSSTQLKAALWSREAVGEGGLLSGQDPSGFNRSDPLRLWIIQLGVIMMTTQLLALGLRKMRQPKVIAEVLGGILLGPTAFGRIPGFSEHIFPNDSQSYLSLTANIGLCLFLFLVGLEIDAGVIKRNARLSATVALAGMCIPFGFGAALSVPLYHRFVDPSIQFTHFMLFTGVAYSITAFPVLCRILTELKLLDTTVGIVVLSAGVGNDIVGWTLLALSVALVNAGSGLMALWILMTCVGWTLFLLFPVKMALQWLARRTGSLENGPSMFFMTVTILVLFGSSFFTDVIGVHAIFGAFLAGIIVPRGGGLAIALTEKLEDIVSIVFLPLYFTISGLSTNLGLLDDGITWGFTVAICALAYSGKFGGCTLAARFAGFSWREASTIGSLMSCKGLVELIVLNVGLQAGILSPRVFSMFVLEALLLTFMTTPAVVFLYPPHMRKRVTATGASFVHADDGDAAPRRSHFRRGHDDLERKERFLVVLDKIEHLPGMMSLTQLIQPPPPYQEEEPDARSGSSDSSRESHKRAVTPGHEEDITLDALRLIEITDRTSAVMKYSSFSTDVLLQTDPLLTIFRTFVELGGSDGGMGSEVKMVPYDDLAVCVKDEAMHKESQMVLVPWIPPTYIHSQAEHDGADGLPIEPNTPRHVSTNPFESIFKSGAGGASGSKHPSSALHSQFIRNVFAMCPADVMLYVDQEQSSSGSSALKKGFTAGKHHLFLPFFGGPDDRLALEFVVQLCAANPKVSATVVRLVKREAEAELSAPASGEEKDQGSKLCDEERNERINALTVGSTTQAFPDTVYGHANTETRLQSSTADSVLWGRYATPPVPHAALFRITFETVHTPLPLHTLIDHIAASAATLRPPAIGSRGKGASKARFLVMCGRSRRLAVESHHTELKAVMEEHGNAHVGNEVRKTVGDVAAAIVLSQCEANIAVVQAAHVALD
ncbi:hypothetical protein EUX98_g1774 [Antrodiella citrinella]|uniref:Cation/H+ exchanger transmembrane domain-containing protein n=1 Tax=Antrodiella citrinella TaxID=2447956 RepID=A0A4S4N0L9_9APHY|nr:hypothetical protein EUX98_g1774 [Antrodiella citrinella]